jgi:hypothetical protein
MSSVCGLADTAPETPPVVAPSIRAVSNTYRRRGSSLPPDRGMKYIPRELAFAKLKALAEGTAIVRRSCAASCVPRRTGDFTIKIISRLPYTENLSWDHRLGHEVGQKSKTWQGNRAFRELPGTNHAACAIRN